MKRFLLVVLTIALSVSANACLNEYNINERGQWNEEFMGLPIFYRSFDTLYCQEYVDGIDFNEKDTMDYKRLSDAGVHLAHLGQYRASLKLFEWLNAHYPNEYQIVANLGTLYEINGEVDSAYKYISLSMKLNVESHHGSEWVHLKILDAKKNLRQDKNWLLTNAVLNLNKLDTVEKYSRELDYIVDTINHISIQLVERIPFTPDRDLILANILNELADLLRIHISIENAFIAYGMAMHYDPEDHYGVQQKIENLRPLLKEYKFHESVLKEHFPDRKEFKKEGNDKPTYYPPFVPAANSNIWVYIIIGVILLFGTFVLFRLKRRKK